MRLLKMAMGLRAMRNAAAQQSLAADRPIAFSSLSSPVWLCAARGWWLKRGDGGSNDQSGKHY